MEHLATVAKKESEFDHFMDSCVAKTIEELNEHCAEGSKTLLRTLKTTNKQMREDLLDRDLMDSRLLLHMASAGVHYKEPNFVQRRSTFAKKKIYVFGNYNTNT